MNISEAIEILTQHNKWRRGATDIEQESPTLIGIAIDEVTIAAGRYEKLRRLNVRDFAALCKRNSDGELFDEMVDELE